MKLTEIFKKKKSVPRANPVTETDVKSPSASATGQQQTTAQTFLNKNGDQKPTPVVSRAGLDEEDLDILAKQGSTKPEIIDPNKTVADGMTVLDVVAPKTFEIDFDYIKINGVYFRTLFVSGYPRFVSPGWLEQIINFDSSLDISFYVYPVEVKGVLEDLRHKIAEMEAEIATDLERGRIVNATTQAKLDDAQLLQEELVKGSEHFYEFAFYITIPAQDLEDLNDITKQVQATLGSLLVSAQAATLDMENGFYSTLPFAADRLSITRNMDTTSLSTTFPLTSAELSSDSGVLYGINPLNESFVIFDRFSMENSNMAIFATSGAGKSYFVKLESLRSLMLGTEVIIIDPEAEYKDLCAAVGGQYITFSYSSLSKINPFDLSQIYEEGENQLGLKVLSLHALFKVIMGALNPMQEALLDHALVETYRAKGITQDPATQKKEPPLMEDLYKILVGMETEPALDLAARIEKFVKGSFIGIFDQQTNVEINNPFTVFSVREVQDALRPIAMFIILEFIWTKVKRDLKKRLLVVDEAWHMMRYPDSAQFMWSIVKRARKYYLGLTTITQDVEDFLTQDIGKAIVTNSAIRLLLKQSPAAIDRVAEVFYLSQGEKQLLLGANIGEGIFFAGNHHVPIYIVSSPEEHKLISTKPADVIRKQQEEALAKKEKEKIDAAPVLQTNKTVASPDFAKNASVVAISTPVNIGIATTAPPDIFDKKVDLTQKSPADVQKTIANKQ
ncbi:MAG: Type IV secretory pathway VirB4 component-like protein [Candidatus Woesebacteria bacterium GW2011_GWA1_39_21]|uniref:Type IV secretory pathway VirB4 component-like protein n=1 Tax=Candidatus Woesebacteria bacterium GW2011_GWA1_39_21 TaxID=1618550 RepID=A0A0G0N757_9BACT|nr:MAG: Type IV secretory pathway VirB4 component-like protein [Candidatus Woesebacteria bacterium GW2011_GWA1_39_21]